MNVLMRTIKEFDLKEVSEHLLVAGDLTGDCYNCKELGLDYLNVKNCPKCKTEFNYISSRRLTTNFKFLHTLFTKRDDLCYVEFADLKHHKDREKAINFLS
jgi:hypothetical protein